MNKSKVITLQRGVTVQPTSIPAPITELYPDTKGFEKFDIAKSRFEHDYLMNLFMITRNVMSEAVRLSGICRQQIYRMLDRNDIQRNHRTFSSNKKG